MRLRGSIANIPSESTALNETFSLAYEELRRLAAQVRSTDPRATLNPTALVNEAWLKLASSSKLNWTSPLHFKRVAARAMRQLLVESARRRKAMKRSAPLVTLDEPLAAVLSSGAPSSEEEFLRLDEALDSLSQLSERQAAIVESRFFGGLTVGETAEALDISEATVLRDWRAARAWLGRELRAAS
jgi:RNA polymerase sigma factor (TIGR02999 family)